MTRFYSNENFPIPTVEVLRALGHDVLTIQETGNANRSLSDADVLSFAISEQRVLLTLNRKHFIKLHRSLGKHAGIVVCSFDPDFEALAKRIHLAVDSEESLASRLIRINRPLD